TDETFSKVSNKPLGSTNPRQPSSRLSSSYLRNLTSTSPTDNIPPAGGVKPSLSNPYARTRPAVWLRAFFGFTPTFSNVPCFPYNPIRTGLAVLPQPFPLMAARLGVVPGS